LKTLDLSKNEVTHIDRDIGNLTTLKKLRMNENLIEEIPIEINFLSDLVEIEFRQNKLSEFLPKLPLQAINLRNLQTLDLSVNKFSSVPRCLVAMSSLKVINMAYNNITNIDSLFNGDLKFLEVLDFSNNKIENISDDIFRLKEKLGFLNLEYNNLSKFPTLVGFMDLKSLKLDGNPLKIIKRTTIEKGTVAILDFLRNRHVGDPPETKSLMQRAPESLNQQQQQQQVTKVPQNEVDFLQSLFPYPYR
jgi:leucine-rich repeat protein SHOC2